MSEARKRKLNTQWIWVPAVLFLILVFFSVRRLTRPELPIRVATVEKQGLTRTNSTNGKVEPEVNFAAHAPTPGVVKKLFIRAGEQVRAGELLLTMDDQDARARLATALSGVRGAEASLASLEAGGTHDEQLNLAESIRKGQLDVETAQKNLATLQQLQARGAASASEVLNARQTLESAKLNGQNLQKRNTDRYAAPDLAHARAALADAKANYAAAQAVVTESNVRAPFAGTVYSLPVSVSEYVQQGAELLQVADLSRLRVRAYFDEPEISSLRDGQTAAILWDAKPNHTWTGAVTQLPSTISNYTTRNVGETLISIDPSDIALLPGVNVTVTVTTEKIADAVTIPRDGLYREAGRDYVYLLAGSTLRRRYVTIGAINLTQVQVLSGIAEGDIVALGTTNGEALAEGVPVRKIQ